MSQSVQKIIDIYNISINTHNTPIEYLMYEEPPHNYRKLTEIIHIDTSKLITIAQIVQRESITNIQDLYNILNKNGEFYTLLQVVYLHILSGAEITINNVTSYNNFLLSYGDPFNFGSTAEAKHSYTTWYEEEYVKNIEKYKNYLKDYKVWNENLNKIKPLETSPLYIEKISKSFEFSYDNDKVYDMFVNAEPSTTVPFIQFSHERIQKTKIYKGSLPTYRTYMDSIYELDKEKRIKTSNTLITMLYYVGKKYNAVDIRTKSNYERCTIEYRRSDRKLVLTVMLDKREMMEQVTEDIIALMGINGVISAEYINGATGEFHIYDCEIDMYAFHYASLNSEIGKYFYLEESTNPISTKKRFNVQYRGSILDTLALNISKVRNFYDSLVQMMLENHAVLEGSKYLVPNKNNLLESKTSTRDMKYIIVRISKAMDIDTLSSFINIISRYFSKFQKEQEKILEKLRRIAPSFEFSKQYKTEKKQSIRGGKRGPDISQQFKNILEKVRGTDLHDKLNTPEYKKSCPAKNLPIVVDKGDIDTLLYEGFFFTCDTKSDYPHISRNSSGFPCCFKRKRDNIDMNLVTQRTFTDTTNKGLLPSQQGNVPAVIYDFLVQIEGVYDIKRYGVNNEINNFIACCLHAIGDKEYLKSNNKEEYLWEVRTKTTEKILMYQQEFYEYTLAEIESIILNREIYYDPILFVRAMEEYIDHNIVIFDETNIGIRGNQQSFYVVPSYQYFYARNPKPKKTICIVRHYGTSADKNRKYPFCECIQYNSNAYVFPEAHFSIFRDMQLYCERSITMTKEMSILSTYYSLFSYDTIFPQFKINGQYCDNYGKCHGFLMTKDNIQYSVFFFPTYPINVPIVNIQNVKYPTKQQVIAEFGTDHITATTMIVGQENGFWYGQGTFKQFMFVPFERTEPEEYSISPIEYNYPLPISMKETPTDKYQNLKYISNIIKQLLLICVYFLDKENANIKEDIKDYLEEKKDTIYEFSFPRVLPKFNNLNSFLDYCEKHCTFVRNRKILTYNWDMYMGIVYYAVKYGEQISGVPLNEDYIFELKDYYEVCMKQNCSAKTHIHIPKNILYFENSNSYEDWKDQVLTPLDDNKRIIANVRSITNLRLKHRFYSIRDPYIYCNIREFFPNIVPLHDDYYLVQNTSTGTLKSALNVAYNWYFNKINIGYYTSDFQPEHDQIPQYELYKIGLDGNILPTTNSGSHICILQYDDVTYAALLQIKI